MEGVIISLYKDDVTLDVWVKDDLSKDKTLFGAIKVSEGMDNEFCYWDNIPFFQNVSRKDFRNECGGDLGKLRHRGNEIYDDIKYLISKAKKLNLL